MKRSFISYLLGYKMGFFLSRMTTYMKFAIIQVLPVQNNLKDLDPSYKMDLDLLDCFGRKTLRLISEEIR